MLVAEDAPNVAFKVRVTAPDGCIAGGACIARGGRSANEHNDAPVIGLVRTDAGRWEYEETPTRTEGVRECPT